LAIEGREYSKFIFTKTLSECLVLIIELGEKLNICREDLAYLDIKLILDAFANLSMESLEKNFRRNISLNKELYPYTEALKLPSLILKKEDIYSFYLENEDPNFITLKNISAAVTLEEDGFENISGKIVFIKSADPGYDFLFSKNICGLVTQFGGANSHMAIRCAELGIPAVIGAGEKLFNFWSKHKIIRIDCSAKQIYPIS
jgi:phosphohistidine swiveling domain-containing protein